ncbi:MAG TPA: nicotinamide riboside transporter PnuC [Flavobacterium sp.]|uniref:nicotinamide riboside transporter PnuC n=1 Tax=Flavobacterium sp. TaxID=239 RepID=UPI002B8CBF03|nr:nicotinamide riboside transporter PnuC [Flavobacterium sp.]HSD13965.1 nicotinamide riboside transporter PnuC [Flavobacterium sp.]
MTFFDINNIAFEVSAYPISYIELIGTLFGFLSVYFASRANILTWSTGIINELFLFILFFQVQLYADMFLQIYFFVVTLYGWYNWKHKPKQNSIISVSFKTKLWIASTIFIGTIVAGFLFANIHMYLPQYFKTQASFPYVDSFVMVLSIIATILLARKEIETWHLWILVDIICVFLFFKKGILFLALEYLIFLGLATYGLLNWKKQLNNG